MIFKNIKQQMKETISQKKDAVIESLKEDIFGKPKEPQQKTPQPKIPQGKNIAASFSSIKEIEDTIKKIVRWEQKCLPRNDNYAIAAFIHISKTNGMPLKKSIDEYPRFLSYQYQVHDPVKYHRWLISEGYLEEASPYIALNKMKVDQLKEILLKNGLEEKGKKIDLIQRIVENVNRDKLPIEPLYVPTKRGLLHLEQYKYIFRLQEYGLTWEDFDNCKAAYPEHLTTNDVIFRALCDLKEKSYIRGDYIATGYWLEQRGKFHESEERYTGALGDYTGALWYETSGCRADDSIKADESIIRPSIAGKICNLGCCYEPDFFDVFFQRYFLAKHAMGEKNFMRLFEDILQDKPLAVENYIKGRK